MELDKQISVLDNIFSEYLLENLSVTNAENKIGKALSVISGKNIEVCIITSHNRKEPFFGMRIFPVAPEMDTFLKYTTSEEVISYKDVLNQWKHINDWYMEIDYECFNRQSANFNPQELTALALHEIGHTIDSDEVVDRWYRAYCECKIRMSSSDKAATKVLYFMYQIPLMSSCALRKWKLGKNGIKGEMSADSLVVKYDYGDSLVNAFNKIIKFYGNTAGYTDDATMTSSIEESVRWCNLNIADVVHRKNKVKDEIYNRTIKHEDGFFKVIGHMIMDTLGVKTSVKYTGAVVESTLELLDSDNFLQKYNLNFDLKRYSFIERAVISAMESANNKVAQESFFRKNKSRKDEVPNQLDVDAIYVEVDRITNHMDRRFVLDLIYNQIEKIEAYKETFEYDDHAKRSNSAKMQGMLDELAELRKAVLAKKDFNKDYKVFVKYPKGYEG